MPNGDGIYMCQKCGKPYNTTDNTSIETCKCNNVAVGFFPYGWICPLCGRANSQMTQTCFCKPLPPIQITC